MDSVYLTPKVTCSQSYSFMCCYLSKSITGKPTVDTHKYTLEVTISGGQIRATDDVILEFSEFLKVLKRAAPADSFVYNADASGDSTEVQVANLLSEDGYKVIGYHTRISAEQLASQIGHAIQCIFETEYANIRVQQVKLKEDSNSYVVWTPSQLISI